MAKVLLRMNQDDPVPKNGSKKVLLRVNKNSASKPDLNAIEKDIESNLAAYETSAKDFYNSYLNSPNYKKRLMAQGNDKPDDAIKLRLANMYVTEAKKHWGKETAYGAPDQKVYINPVSFLQYPDLKPRSTVAHEFSHVVGAMVPGHPKMPAPMTMNEKESHEIEKRNKFRKLSADQWNRLPLSVRLDAEHDINPNETKADLDAIRYMLYTDGIYDTGTQEFNKETLKKVKAKYGNDRMIKRLQDNYSDEDIIWMMNNIAAKNKTNSNLA